MRILVDMDGVISDYDKSFVAEWRRQHPEKAHEHFVGRKTFYADDVAPEEHKDFIKGIQAQDGFYGGLEPIPGAIEALKEMKAMGHEVFICTSPSVSSNTCVQDKFTWVARHLGEEWKHNIVLTKDKTVVMGDILIDDKPRVDGVEGRPAWVHVLYDQSYNRWLKKVKRLNWQGNWKGVLFGGNSDA